MDRSAKTSSLVLAGSLLFAAILDRAVIARQLPAASNALLVKPGLVLFGVPFLPENVFGVLSLLVIPLIALGIMVVPVTSPGDRRAWIGAWVRWRRLAIALLLIPVFMLAGGFVYSLLKEYVPGPIATFAESFGFKPTFYVGSAATPLVGPLDGSLACLVGLAGGLWLVQKCMRK